MNIRHLLALLLASLPTACGTPDQAAPNAGGACGCQSGDSGEGGETDSPAGKGGQAGNGGRAGTGGKAGRGGVAGEPEEGCNGQCRPPVAGASGRGGRGGQGGMPGTSGAGMSSSGTAGTAGGGQGGDGGASAGQSGAGMAGAAGTATGMNGPVNLGTAGDFVILAQSGVSNIPQSVIVGDVGVSPIAATAITGFSLIQIPPNQFATSTQVVGLVFAPDFAPPTPAKMTTAIGDMLSAYTDAASRAPGFVEHGAGDLSGLTLSPAVYKFSTGVLISTDVSLNGPPTGVWIFQIAGTLTVGNGARIEMAGGLARNVFWQVADAVDFGTTAHISGSVLGKTSIVFHTGASMAGRALAQTAVVLDANAIAQP